MAEQHGYVGRCRECRGMVACQVDEPEERERTAEALREFVLTGYIVDRLPVDQIRKQFDGHASGCKLHRGLE